jgi:hypothetical protein
MRGAWLIVVLALAGVSRADEPAVRPVTIWSEGTRMAGDLYVPADFKPTDRRPAVIFCAGTGGTRKGTPQKMGPWFAAAGFVFLAFDYRGWGESDSRLMMTEPMPKPDAKGMVSVQARAIRWSMDAVDQTTDIRSAVDFLRGEPGVDADRIGLIGSSYGGGLVVWAAAHDGRVKCVAAQVPGMGGGRGEPFRKRADELATKQARGEAEPIPQDTGQMTGKLAKYAQMRVNTARQGLYDPIAAAGMLKAPTLIIDAEHDELMDIHQNGEKVYNTLKSRGVATEYHVLPGITHYGIYKEGFDEATRMEVAWFLRWLK